ncbi:hypothetical protein [Streptomyces sp. NWU49]|uniref:hypothetical protein n=1 Tax=Streptomyces sp. NWU49 TaxID=2201153 RepID=UPI00215A7B6F|nr:hypothetical protein [Streptomyces sp. NWU49]
MEAQFFVVRFGQQEAILVAGPQQHVLFHGGDGDGDQPRKVAAEPLGDVLGVLRGQVDRGAEISRASSVFPNTGTLGIRRARATYPCLSLREVCYP